MYSSIVSEVSWKNTGSLVGLQGHDNTNSATDAFTNNKFRPVIIDLLQVYGYIRCLYTTHKLILVSALTSDPRYLRNCVVIACYKLVAVTSRNSSRF